MASLRSFLCFSLTGHQENIRCYVCARPFAMIPPAYVVNCVFASTNANILLLTHSPSNNKSTIVFDLQPMHARRQDVPTLTSNRPAEALATRGNYGQRRGSSTRNSTSFAQFTMHCTADATDATNATNATSVHATTGIQAERNSHCLLDALRNRGRFLSLSATGKQYDELR